MNIKGFCEHFRLGNVETVKKLSGGFMHKMFEVKTTQGHFAIKVLNPEVMSRVDAMSNFLISEKISNYANSCGVPASCALLLEGNSVNFFEDFYYMVFDFVSGKVLKDDEITVEHCRNIGSILSQLHSLEYHSLEFDEEIRKDHFFVDWESYVKIPSFQRMSYCDAYLKHYSKYESLLKRSVERWNESNTSISICHKDMDPKNVMFDGEEPIIIDWESATLSNPYRELIEVALSWSGFLSNQFQEEKFRAVIEEYIKIKPFEHHRYDLICGNLIGRFGWLDYNLKRSLGMKSKDKEEMKLAEQEVSKMIDEIERYVKLIPDMYDIICEFTKESNHEYDSVIDKIICSNEILRGFSYNKLNIGFTNVIYKVGSYIVKICTDVENEKHFEQEIAFYEYQKIIRFFRSYM